MVDQHLGAAYSNTNGCCLKALAATETDVLEQFIAVRVISKFYFFCSTCACIFIDKLYVPFSCRFDHDVLVSIAEPYLSNIGSCLPNTFLPEIISW